MKPAPLEFFSAQHGIDPALLQRVLAEALGHGGDFADIYVEFRQSTSLLLEESLLKGSSESVSLGAGVRVLGVPTGLDRLLQQAIHQLLGPIDEPTFSAFSDGFRPGKSAQQAGRQAQRYQQEGKAGSWIWTWRSFSMRSSTTSCYRNCPTG